MSLNANHLKNNESQNRIIKNEISDLLTFIDEEIITHRQSNPRPPAIISLPILFNIPNMSNAEAQKRIYCGIITSLKNRNFKPLFNIKPNSILLKVSWLSAEEMDELVKMDTLLAHHTEKTANNLTLK